MEMTNMPSSARTSKIPTPTQDSISIADAKTHLSSVLSGVERKKRAVTILRRGVPIAQIVPIAAVQPVSGYGWMRGTVQELGDIVGPTGVEWTAGDD
jgi:prevent-host-death family protein